jgi:very-long-chain enoyl-CoA reductase
MCSGKPIKNLPEETSLDLNVPASELYHRLAAELGLSTHQLRITKGSDGTVVPNLKDVTIGQTGLRAQSVIYVKNLGRHSELRLFNALS